MKLMPTIIFIVVAVAIVTAIAFARAQRNRVAKPQFKTTDEMMQFLAASAVDMANKSYGVKLDYSPESIQKVEEVLGKIHDEYLQTKPTSGVQGLAMAYGAYIGEVIKHSEPNVKWEQSDSVGGQNSYPLIWNGGSSYVCAWCYRRITNGDEDNVWLKYTAIKNKSWKNPAGETNAAANN